MPGQLQVVQNVIECLLSDPPAFTGRRPFQRRVGVMRFQPRTGFGIELCAKAKALVVWMHCHNGVPARA